jgi:hypothetical protein
MGGGGFAELAGGGELGGRLDDACDDHGERQPGQPHRPAWQQPVEAELARHAEHGGDMTVRQGALDADLVGGGGEAGVAFQHPAQRLDLGVRPVGQVGEGAGLDLVAVTVALAQQHGGWRGAVGHAGDIHVRTESRRPAPTQAKSDILHAYKEHLRA